MNPLSLTAEAKTFSECWKVPLVFLLFPRHLVVMGFSFTD